MNRMLALAIALLCLPAVLGYTGTAAQSGDPHYTVRLPFVVKGDPQPAPSPDPLPGELPAELVGTWFAGQLLPRAIYDPSTGEWGSANGLSQMYTFADDGAYTYQGFFRVENPGCATEVSVYRQGTAAVDGETLKLTPVIVKTRTATYCGGTKVTLTEGPYDPRLLPWNIDYTQFRIKQLTISEDGKTTSYYKAGMAEELVGAWHNGALTSSGFYNPSTQTFAAQPDTGWWIEISADGRYRWGEFDYATDAQGCELAGWIYLEGEVNVAGSHITFTPDSGMVRVENACTPDAPRQEPWKDPSKGFTWLFRDYQTNPTLVLIPDARFEEFKFLPE